jgi:uncharacterized protein (DUF305 family)
MLPLSQQPSRRRFPCAARAGANFRIPTIVAPETGRRRMTKPLQLWIAAALLAAVTTRTVGAQTAAPRAAADTMRPRATPADVQFMQHMIGHHAQALAMTALLPARTQRNDMRLLGERIAVSQRDEIATMRRWLTRHGAAVPDAAAPMPHDRPADHAMGHATGHAMAAHDSLMPGMLTPAEMDRLAKTTGPAFDRLFLQSMIRHHEGALAMVAALFATRGAGQDAEVFAFASDVDTDQRAEIARMRALLAAMPAAPR